MKRTTMKVAFVALSVSLLCRAPLTASEEDETGSSHPSDADMDKVGQYLVRFKNNVGKTDVMQLAAAGQVGSVVPELNLMTVKLTKGDAAKLALDPNVDRVEEDVELETAMLRGSKPKTEAQTADEDDTVGQFLVRYKNNVGKADAVQLAAAGQVSSVIPEMNLMAIKLTKGDAAKLARDPNVERVEEDVEMENALMKDEEQDTEAQTGDARRRLSETTPYGIDMVQAPLVPSSSGSNSTVMKVCVVDTGYGLGHPDLPNTTHGVQGWHDPTQESYDGKWDEDRYGYGTRCAGIIGAIGGNDRGITSVNPDPNKFNFYISKASRSRSASTSEVLAAMQACVNAGSNVISVSYETRYFSQIAQDAFKAAYDRGILIVAGAGNSGSLSYDYYPASYPYVMSVAAVDSDESRTYFSAFNDQVEIAAPGDNVYSTTTSYYSSFYYDSRSGTAMACSHVAGVAALVWSHFPGCSNNQIRNVLLKTAKDKAQPWCNTKYGHGLVQAKNAYDLLAREGCDAGGPVTNPLSDGAVGGCPQAPCSSSSECNDGNPCTIDTCLGSGICDSKRDEYCDPCEANQTHIGIDLITDRRAYQTLWQIIERNTNQVVYSGSGYDNEETYHIDHCVANTSCYDFTIYDSSGNGICCDSYYGYGNYTVWYGSKGLMLAHGGQFEDSETVPIPCSPNEILTFELDLLTDNYPMESWWQITNATSGTVAKTGGYYDKALRSKHINVELELLSSGCYNFTLHDTYGDGICCDFGAGNYTVSVDGSSWHASDGNFGSMDSTFFGRCPCEPGETLFEIDLATDGRAHETKWYVKDSNNNTVISTAGKLACVKDNANAFCLPSTDCYSFVIMDDSGDGICCSHGDGQYAIQWNGGPVTSGGDFGSSAVHKFGQCGN